jgi:acyl-coenzyme A thioesterase PaaI-like protein
LVLWQKCRNLPFGAQLFGMALRFSVPYTGALGPRVLQLEPGFARVALDDRRGVRNHLDSIHALALANLGEFASGAAMTTALSADIRSIVTGLTVEYVKKARGTVIAEARVTVPQVHGDVERDVRAEIRDGAGDMVSVITVRWKLSPRP